MVRRQTWQAQRFKIFELARHFRIELNRDVRFEFESNLEASQVPSGNVLALINVAALRQIWLVPGWVTVCGWVNHLST